MTFKNTIEAQLLIKIMAKEMANGPTRTYFETNEGLKSLSQVREWNQEKRWKTFRSKGFRLRVLSTTPEEGDPPTEIREWAKRNLPRRRAIPWFVYIRHQGEWSLLVGSETLSLMQQKTREGRLFLWVSWSPLKLKGNRQVIRPWAFPLHSRERSSHLKQNTLVSISPYEGKEIEGRFQEDHALPITPGKYIQEQVPAPDESQFAIADIQLRVSPGFYQFVEEDPDFLRPYPPTPGKSIILPTSRVKRNLTTSFEVSKE